MTLVYLVEITPAADTRWDVPDVELITDLKAFAEAWLKFRTRGPLPAVQVTSERLIRGQGDGNAPAGPTPGPGR